MNKCKVCGVGVADIVASFSGKRFGEVLCMKHQTGQALEKKKEEYMEKVEDQAQRWGDPDAV